MSTRNRRRRRPPDGQRADPADPRDQALRFLGAFSLAVVSLAIIATAAVICVAYLFLHGLDGTEEEFPLWLQVLWAAAACLALLYLRSPASKAQPLKGIPIERIDFASALRFQRRQLCFAMAMAIVVILPILYLEGFVDHLAARLTATGVHLQIARACAWLGSVALSGIIGNLAFFGLLSVLRWVARPLIARREG